MSNKKRNLGKIALLTAAMAVTVPTAVMLSACGGNEHNEYTAWYADNEEMHWHVCQGGQCTEHTYSLGKHDWIIDSDNHGWKYRCSVCGFRANSVEGEPILVIKDAWEKANHSNTFTYEFYDAEKEQTKTISCNRSTGEGSIWTRTAIKGTDGTTSYEDRVILKVYQNAAGEYIACKYNNAYNPDNKNENAPRKYLYYKVDEHYFFEHEQYTDLIKEFDPNMYTFAGSDLGKVFRGLDCYYDSAVEYSFKQRAYNLVYDPEITVDEKDGVLTITVSSAYEGRDGSCSNSSFVFTLENDVLTLRSEYDSKYFSYDGAHPEQHEEIHEHRFARQSTGYEPVAVEEPSDADEIETLTPKAEFSFYVYKDGAYLDNIHFVLPFEYGTVIEIAAYHEQLKAIIAEKIEGVTIDQIEITDNGWNPDKYTVNWSEMVAYFLKATITTQSDGE